MLWTPSPYDPDRFDIEDLKKMSKWRELKARMSEQELEDLADELTEICRKYPVDRGTMIKTCGTSALQRKSEIETVLKETVGIRLDWKVVGVNYNGLKGGAGSRLLASCFMMTPQVSFCFFRLKFIN